MIIPLPDPDEISLYIHIPFCTRKCGYCHFFVIREEEEKKELLLRALKKEISLYAPLFNEKNLVSIYFGGGTPSLFGAKRIANILAAIYASCPKRSDTLEITMEANPEALSRQILTEYRNIGINRLSIGVQSFNDNELSLLTRTHSAKVAKDAVETAFSIGIDNLSIDLMYEIPGQTTTSWQKSLQEAVSLPISHISLYNMTIEQGTAFYRKKHFWLPMLPEEKAASRMLSDLNTTLLSNGFTRYEISAYCRQGLYSKHNTGYWLGRPFLGLGPSAFSYLPPKRLQNAPNFPLYLKKIIAKETATTFSETLPQEARLRELFAVELRLTQGVHKESFERRYHPLPPSLWDEWQKLKKDGLVEEEEGMLRLTEKGKNFYDTVASSVV